MNFYLSVVDDQLRHPGDQPSIGIILCKGRNEVIVEYALRDTIKPMGVAQYRVSPALPEQLRNDLPTVEDLASEYPALSLLKLRMEIERAMQDFAAEQGVPSDHMQGIGPILQELERRGLAPATAGRLLDALKVMNQAVHGLSVEAAPAEQAIHIGAEFLIELSGLKR